MPLSRRDRDMPKPERKPPTSGFAGGMAGARPLPLPGWRWPDAPSPWWAIRRSSSSTLTLFLSRAAAERLTARAIEESRRLEDIVREILERGAGE